MTALRTAAETNPTEPNPAGTTPGPAEPAEFSVALDNFEGPFDLLLQLIGRHQLDITEVALSRVTDEFIGHLRAAGAAWDLDQASQFVVVAATLLDLKAARLLPGGDVEDAEDIALLEARDLLFARLLQYRAFKVVAGWMSARLVEEGRRHPRPGGLEASFAALLPPVTIPLTAQQFAQLAARALAGKPEQPLPLAHLHAAHVSVREQAGIMVTLLEDAGALTFRQLTDGVPDRLHVVARFLGLLELFQRGAVTFEQHSPLGELTVRWTGAAADLLDSIGEREPSL